MTAIVFAGPSLPERLRPQADGLAYLPPAAMGDVIRAVNRRPQAIGIVDGYFEGRLSVWHKEILWAMAQGIHVFGSASMGALRAAELAPFGMRGVGRIFAEYAAGRLEDDDEVAVLHGPPETGYAALTEPMVNVRATLDRALADGIVAAATRDALARLAKAQFYKARTWPALLDAAAGDGLPAADLARLRDWLPEGAIDLKCADALEMVDAMTAFLATDPAPMASGFDLAWTQMWDMALASADERAPDADISPDAVLDELRLDRPAWAAATERALVRHLALRDAARRGATAAATARQDALMDLRLRHGLSRRTDLDAWLDAQHADAQWLEAAIADEALLARLRQAVAPALGPHILDELRLDGAYAGLAERAAEKRAALEARGLDDRDPYAADVSPAALLAWFYAGEEMPDDIDAAARALGFNDRAQFYAALLGEYLFRRCQA